VTKGAAPRNRCCAFVAVCSLVQKPSRAGETTAELTQRDVADTLAGLRGGDGGALRDHKLNVAPALGEQEIARTEIAEANPPPCM
jgi:hypothetical protein